MRTIKFRLWDKEGEEMALPNEIFEVLISMDNKVFAMVKNNDNSIGEIDRSNTVIMQYTGLKDKNGIEIYEGDIVQIGSMFQENVKKRIGQVVFERGKYIFYVNDFYKYELEIMGLTLEVIGNIYEHKHLLEEYKNENK